MHNIQPLGNRVLVKRSEARKTKSGIILPDSAQEKQRQGEIVAVGPGKMNKNGGVLPLDLSVGDTVVFSSYAGVEVKGEAREEFLILSEDDILAVLN